MRRLLLAFTLLGPACGSDATAAADCGDITGELRTIAVDVEPIAPSGSEEALLWLPACVDPDRLQIVMLMHGAGLKPATWFDEPVDAANVAERLDRSDVDTAVLTPGGAGGNQLFVDHTLEPLLDAVGAELGVLPPIVGIGGYSAGGPTLARLAFGPDRIEVENVVVSAPVWAPQYTRWVEANLADTSIRTLLLDAGANDGLGRSLAEIREAALDSEASAEVLLERPPGGHNIAYLASRIDVWLAVLAGVELLDVIPPTAE